MPDQTIDLSTAISTLEARFDELSDLLGTCPGPTPAEILQQRRMLRSTMAGLHEQIDVLETIRSNLVGSTVVVSSLTNKEVSDFKAALSALNRPIQAGQVFKNSIAFTTDFLNAATTLVGTAQKG